MITARWVYTSPHVYTCVGPSGVEQKDLSVRRHTFTPMLLRIRSATLPTPGTLRIGKSLINALTTFVSPANSNCPSGLFLSEHILASSLLGAIPALMVRPVSASTAARRWETTSEADISWSVMYGVMLQKGKPGKRNLSLARWENAERTLGILHQVQP